MIKEEKRLKALILAAGLGTRLQPITYATPKCLVDINGKPLLAYWLEKLEHAGCEEVLINTHHLADKVMGFVNSWRSSSLKIKTIHETELLGTARTLLVNQNFFKNCRGLLIHADNAMSADIKPFITSYEERNKRCIITMLTFTTSTPSSCGIVEVDKKNIVTSFHEKVRNPPSNRANGALYAFGAELLEYLNRMHPRPIDFSNDVLPTLMGRIQTKHTNEPFIDIGTPESLEVARTIWKNQNT